MTTVVVGAGPAGLGAANEFVEAGRKCLLVEADERVGGRSQTLEHNGYRFDVGGHRFDIKYEEVVELWEKLIGDDWLTRRRLSKICYAGKFFHYPLQPRDAVHGLGLAAGTRAVLSYMAAQIKPSRDDDFRGWVVAQFGEELFRTFFKTYTEKVWGITCSELSSDMAEQRIRGFSLANVLMEMLGIGRRSQGWNTDTFQYPRYGPQMLWESMAQRIYERGGTICLSHEVERLSLRDGEVVSVDVATAEGLEQFPVSEILSTMPLVDLVHAIDPAPPREVIDAAEGLQYRDFVEVVIISRQEDPFPYTWLYVHDPDLQVGRVQNFRAWSPQLVPDPDTTSIGCEYFCFEEDDFWSMPDEDLIELAVEESAHLGLIEPSAVEDGLVVRMTKAYPILDLTYREKVGTIRRYLHGIPNLETAGRNGMHRYFTQNESQMAGLLAARRLTGAQQADPWKIQTGEY